MLYQVFFFVDTKLSAIGKGRLTERLLAQGILTPNMLQELKKEWDNNSSDPDDEPRKTRRKRRTK